MVPFVISSISEWMMELNTWENTEDAEEARTTRTKMELENLQSPKHIVMLERDIDAMSIDVHNPEGVRKQYGLEVYDKVLGDSAYHISIAMPPDFQDEIFPEVT